MYDPSEAAKYKDLPSPPKTDYANSVEKDYFAQTEAVEQLSPAGLGRKRSLMQRVGGVVRGRK